MDFNMSAELFKALADPSRLKVLQLLSQPPANTCTAAGTVCACDLEGELGLSQPTVSHHMRLLRAQQLLSALQQPDFNASACQTSTSQGVNL